jgi:hypothetical protein
MALDKRDDVVDDEPLGDGRDVSQEDNGTRAIAEDGRTSRP